MEVESGKNRSLGKARRGIGIRCWCRGDVGGKAPPLEEEVKMAVERWEKIVGYATRAGSEGDVSVG